MKYVSSEALSKETLMLEYFSLVRMVAKKMATRLPASVEIDNLISAGLIGLMQALDRYKPEKGFKFKTFAEFRIRGAMLDELRSQDWAPKGMRQKAKQFAILCEKLQAKNGHKATDEELRRALHLDKVKYEQLVRDVNTLDQMNMAGYTRENRDDESTSTAIELVPDQGLASDPLANAANHDVREYLEKAIVNLAPQEQQVLALYYFEDLNLKEIGSRMHISESRVCQLHTKAIANLKLNLQDNAFEDDEDSQSLAA